MSQQDPPKFDREIHIGWVEAIVDTGVNLTVWEEGFVADLDMLLKIGENLKSRKQEVILERIYADRTP